MIKLTWNLPHRIHQSIVPVHQHLLGLHQLLLLLQVHLLLLLLHRQQPRAWRGVDGLSLGRRGFLMVVGEEVVHGVDFRAVEDLRIFW